MNQPRITQLKSIRLVDFKSFVDETIPLAPLTMLVGGNASGKSNMLDALRFLQGLGINLQLNDVLNGAAEGGRIGLRGGGREVARVGATRFTIETVWALEDGEAIVELCHAITCQVEPELEIVAERLAIVGDRVPLYEVFPKDEITGGLGLGNTNMVAFREPAGTQPNSLVLFTNTRAIFNDPSSPVEKDSLVAPYCLALKKALSQISMIDLDPRAMRTYAARKTRHLGSQGENLSAIVWRLCQNAEHKQTLVDWLSELCSPRVVDLAFIEVPELDDVMLEVVEEGGARISVRSLSDGTLRFLGLLTFLMTSPAGAVLLVEEIETGLHPTRASLIVEAMESWVLERGIQVLATTHSPLILQAMAPERLDQAVVFGRAPEAQGTIARRLGELPHFEEIAQRRGVDHLFTTGWLERAL